MAIERESTRLFREARRARRMIGDRAGEAAAAQVGEYAAKVAATEPAGIGSREERMARQSLRRQSAALASGFRPEGGTGETTAATGNVLNARQNLFKKMQAAGPESAASFRKEAAALGVTDLGFDRALRSVGGTSGTANTPTAPATTPTPAPTTTPAPTASNQDNIPLFLRRTQEKSVTTSAAPVSMINGKPASEVLGPREDKDLTKADILRRAREESATNPSVTRQDVIDRLNAERREKGMADVNITGKELAAADIEQQTNVEAASSLQGQKFFNTMDKIEASLKPKPVTPPRFVGPPSSAAPKPTTATPTEPTDAELMAKIPSAPAILYGRLGERLKETLPGRLIGADQGLLGSAAIKAGQFANRLNIGGQAVQLGKATGALASATAGAIQRGAEDIRKQELKRMRDELRAKKAAQQ